MSIWFVFLFLLIVTVFLGMGYVAFHPQLIGEFFGHIVAGYEGVGG